MAKELKNLKGKEIKEIELAKGEHNLYITFTDGTELEVGLDCYDFDRYKLEVEIN